jgi:hypothetical protein
MAAMLALGLLLPLAEVTAARQGPTCGPGAAGFGIRNTVAEGITRSGPQGQGNPT